MFNLKDSRKFTALWNENTIYPEYDNEVDHLGVHCTSWLLRVFFISFSVMILCSQISEVILSLKNL